MIDYNVVTNPKHALAIWLLANTTLSERKIGRIIKMNHSQVFRVNTANRIIPYENIKYPIRAYYNDRITGVHQGLTIKMTDEEIANYDVFKNIVLPKIMKKQEEEQLNLLSQKMKLQCFYTGIYEIYKLDEPEKNYVGESESIGVRISQHFPHSSNPSLQEDMFTYGVDAFGWRVLEEIPEELNTADYRKDREGYHIRTRNAYYNYHYSRAFLTIHKKTKVMQRYVTQQSFYHDMGIEPNGNLSQVLQGILISYKGYYAVYEDKWTEDWQPPKDGRLKGVKHA